MKTTLARKILTLTSLLTFSAIANVERPGGGDLNPGLYTNQESIEHFQDLKVGLSIHWGPSAHGGKEISWSRGNEIPKETYDNYYKIFNPTKFDAQQWMQLANDGGMKYIVLTSKHHDGFSLWPSKVTEYDIENTPFKRDIVGELVDAAKQKNIMFGSYYSILDWYHPDYQPYDHGGPGDLFPTYDDTPNFNRYLTFMKAQLRELVVDYGAKIIQLDGEWGPTWNHQLGSDLYLYLRYLDDSVLVSNRTDVGREHLNPETNMWDWKIYAGDFDERERMVDWIQKESHVFGKSDNPWQAWVTIDTAQWAWNETPNLLTVDDIILDLVKTIGDNGNYLINLGPMTNGAFNPVQADIIREVGQWIKKYDKAIYETRGGDYSVEGQYTTTVNGDTLYLFILDSALTEITFDTKGKKFTKVANYNGKKLKAETKAGVLSVHVHKDDSQTVRVVKMHIS